MPKKKEKSLTFFFFKGGAFRTYRQIVNLETGFLFLQVSIADVSSETIKQDNFGIVFNSRHEVWPKYRSTYLHKKSVLPNNLPSIHRPLSQCTGEEMCQQPHNLSHTPPGMYYRRCLYNHWCSRIDHERVELNLGMSLLSK